MIVQRLLEAQEHEGFLRDELLKSVAREAGVPLYRVQEVASFFPHFRREWDKPARVEVKVCRDLACHLRGSSPLLGDDGLKMLAKPGDVSVEGVSCLGRCDRAPVCLISRRGDDDAAFAEHLYVGRTTDELEGIIGDCIAGRRPPTPDSDSTYAPHGNQRDWQIDIYADPKRFGDRSYRAVQKYLRAFPNPIRGGDPKAHPWLARLDPSGLLGMGGAGVPAYRKWLDVWLAAGDEKYVVCNGDESEPATFKDREILLRLAHLVVEGVILAGLMTNATAGYIYIRHEYIEQIAAVRREIERAIELRACGSNIFGTGRDFSVEVFVSPGGYICGEQSALLEAMEDRRAQPRNRPPELSTNGLRDKPTLVNNVETLAWTPAILLRHDAKREADEYSTQLRELTAQADAKLVAATDDAARERANRQLKSAPSDAARAAAIAASWYANSGRPGFRGRRLLSICGDLEKPGVYEIPIGLTLGELIDVAGGVSAGRPLGAVAPSGPSGGLLPVMLPVTGDWQARLARKPDDIGREQWENLTRCIRAGIDPGSGRFDIRQLPLDSMLFRLVGSALGLRIGLMLGAGLAVYGEGIDPLDQALNFSEFFRNESCGKCVPCRLGSQELVELGSRLRSGGADVAAVREDVFDLAYTLSVTSICGLGVVAPNPLATTLDLFFAPR